MKEIECTRRLSHTGYIVIETVRVKQEENKVSRLIAKKGENSVRKKCGRDGWWEGGEGGRGAGVPMQA